MGGVIVLRLAGLRKEKFAFGDLVVGVDVENVNVRRTGADDLVAQDADGHGGVDVLALVERDDLVAHAVAVGVFEDEDAIAFGPRFLVATVVLHFTDPDAAAVIDVEVGWIADLRLGGEQ